MPPRPLALVRPPSAAFAWALRRDPAARPDPAAAQAQHARYVEALQHLADVRVLPPEDDLPDSSFVEDVAIVIAGIALLTRPGASSRRAEVERLAPHLPDWLRVLRMQSGTLDGGDVLRVGSTLFVGRSSRTDARGIQSLQQAFPDLDVVPLAVPGALHLKCHATALDDRHVLVAEGFLAPAALSGRATPIFVPADEAYAANVVAVGDQALVADGFPETAQAVARHGLRVHAVPMSAFADADGSLTCLSLICAPPLEPRGP